MKKYDYILFDLDGTLTDSSEGITRSVVYSLEKQGIKTKAPDAYYSFIGPPLDDSYGAMGMDKDQVDESIRLYRERYETLGWKENKPYEGIIDLLDILSQNHTLGVATSKPTLFAQRILELFQMDKYFKVIVGSNMDRTRLAKREVIEEVLVQLGNPERPRVLMIGDREHDLIGAVQHGVDAIRVLYGFGTEKEHEGHKYLEICRSVEDLKNTILNEI